MQNINTEAKLKLKFLAAAKLANKKIQAWLQALRIYVAIEIMCLVISLGKNSVQVNSAAKIYIHLQRHQCHHGNASASQLMATVTITIAPIKVRQQDEN